jgi:hypothetical protein
VDATVTCPYCGEPTEIAVDDEAGKQAFIQDCDVCCRPIQIRARVTRDGRVSIDADRG